MSGAGEWDGIAGRVERILERVEKMLEQGAPPDAEEADFAGFWAFRWQGGALVPVRHPHVVELDDLVGIDYAKERLLRNTEQFVSGVPANNVLLWGERGNGKSSCVKGLLKPFGPRGLRLIEVHRGDLLSLPAIAERLRELPYRFIVFCDDLTFGEAGDEFRALKTLLDGGVEERPGNVLIYATSNRRHLMPEPMSDNTGGGEIHPEEAVSDKLALADRFGLSIGFSTFDQEAYLAIVRGYAERRQLRIDWPDLRREALRWAMYSGRRSGRGARQFIDDLQGRLALEEGEVK